MVVAFPPGGLADNTARPAATALERILKQPVAIINKAGAAGAVGNQTVATAKPDGYTLLMALGSGHPGGEEHRRADDGDSGGRSDEGAAVTSQEAEADQPDGTGDGDRRKPCRGPGGFLRALAHGHRARSARPRVRRHCREPAGLSERWCRVTRMACIACMTRADLVVPDMARDNYSCPHLR